MKIKNIFRIFAIILIFFAESIYSHAAAAPKIMLGIDVLESMGFKPIAGKRVGLLTHPAGVNRYGKSTIDILNSARNVNLCALFGPEHGIYGNEKADVPVLDLQDVGSRSYTYASCMLRAMEACFENGKEVVVLDRPNPLGGLKVDGPPLDLKFKSYVGMFRVPYVHSMTIGELARFAKGTEGAMEITSKAQRNGRLTVIPMRGWKRSMLWPDTGLKWVPTSPAIPSPAAAFGYSMTGLGCQAGGFQHGYGTQYPFRMLTFPNKTPKQIEAELRKADIPGLSYRPVSAKDKKGKSVDGLYVLINDWNKVNPTEISFHLMRITCKFNGGNIFRHLPEQQALLFNKHTGSEAWWRELYTKGANADVEKFVAQWKRNNAAFQKSIQKFRLYN